MNIEEAKKIIQNKIQADEAAREVRSQIKTYLHEKQNAKEGFTETFKPLIETSEKVKESIDTERNKSIKQLQGNQLALTAGFEGNRKAITSGFDKMDEVKKWDLEQLPGYEAIEELEKDEKEDEKEEEENLYRKKLYLITRKKFEMDNYLALAETQKDTEWHDYYLKKHKKKKKDIAELKKEVSLLEKSLKEKEEKEKEKNNKKKKKQKKEILN